MSSIPLAATDTIDFSALIESVRAQVSKLEKEIHAAFHAAQPKPADFPPTVKRRAETYGAEFIDPFAHSRSHQRAYREEIKDFTGRQRPVPTYVVPFHYGV